MSNPPLPAFISTRADGITLALRVQPRASRTGIGIEHGGELRVSVTAPPVDAAANEVVVRLLADVLDCPRAAIEIIRGQSSRHKVVLVRGVSPALAAERLASASRTAS